MANFGMPYMGSKDKIIPSIASIFPKKKHFYDLFGGGGSVTHYMAVNRSSQYQHFHYNEIVPSTADVIKRACQGEFSYSRFQPKWISREEFFKKKDHDAYIRICWSFGNSQRTYLFGKAIEYYKRSIHQAVVFAEFDDLAKKTLGFGVWPTKVKTIYQRRQYLRQKIEWYRAKNRIPKCLHKFLNSKQLQQLEQLKQLEQLQQLQQLERLQQLEQLEQLQQKTITITSLDYKKVPIEKDSIVYCDIPYKDTASYLGSFNHKEFYEWATTRDFPVYVSEYKIDHPKLKEVYSIDKYSLFKNTGDKKKNMQERLYWNGVD